MTTTEATQKSLFDDDEEPTLDELFDDDEEPTPHELFMDFNYRNPQVYDALVDLAREARRVNGRAKIGIGMLFEVLRWTMFMETGDHEGFKLNNNYRSRYARRIMERESDLRDLFDTRDLRS